MNNPQARNIFAEFFNGQPNIMTPHRIGYAMRAAGSLAIELSSGEGIDGRPIYGVTVLCASDPTNRDARGLSELFESESDARRYMNSDKIRGWRASA